MVNYLTSEEILPSGPSQIMQQTKLIYSSLGKAFGKETKTINNQGEKHIKVIANQNNDNNNDNNNNSK